MFALPARIDLISVPVSTSPASNVSSIVNSWRALRLTATVESSRMGWLLGRSSDRAHVRWHRIGALGSWRTNAGPCGPAFELLTTHRGVRLDGHLLRGGAATRTVDHCTSPPFVPRHLMRCRDRAQGLVRGTVTARARRLRSADPCADSNDLLPMPPGQRNGSPRRVSEPFPALGGSPATDRGASGRDLLQRADAGLAREHLQGALQDRVVPGRDIVGDRHDDIGFDPHVVDPAAIRGQPLRDRQAERPALTRELLPLLDGPLAEGRRPDERRPGPCPAGRPRRSRSPTRCRRRSGTRR